MIIDTILTDTQLKTVSDIIQKKAAYEGVLAAVQTEKALKNSEWVVKEQAVKTELSKLEVELRSLRQVKE